jgi:hypothetical protein
MMFVNLAGSKFQDSWSFFENHDLGFFPRFNARLGHLRALRYVP